MIEHVALERVSLFAELPPHDLEMLARSLRRRRYARDHVICSRGDPGNCLYLIESGRVKISLSSTDGKELVLNVLGPGEFFGELALLDGEPRSADAVAVEESRVLLLLRDDFVRFVDERPRVALRLLSVVGRWLRHATQVAHDEAFLDVAARVARVLLDLADAQTEEPEEGLTSVTGLTQSDIAALIGVSRESVNKCLGSYERQGVIRRDGTGITILRPDLLRRRLES